MMEWDNVLYDGRRNAFDSLVQEIGIQLSRADGDSIEVSERVPESLREKGGVKLLEQLWKQGRFSLWRTAGLCEILRKCGRYDLAERVASGYQANFPDLPESPRLRYKSMQYERGLSSLTVRTASHSRSSSSPDPNPRFNHRRVPSLDSPPSVEEMERTRSPARASQTRGFGASHSEIDLCSMSYSSPVQEQESSRFTHTVLSTQRSEPFHEMSPQECRLRMKAMDIVAKLAICKSCSDIQTSMTSESSFRAHSDTDLQAQGGDPVISDIATPTLNRRASENQSPDNGSQDDFLDDILNDYDQVASTPNLSPTPHPPQQSKPAEVVSSTSSASGISRKLKLPRPLSGYCKTQGKVVWELKQDRLLKCLSKSGYERLVLSEKIDLDVGQGRQNPKLSLVLYPKGLFINQGKGVSLQANVSVSDKCPPLPPSLLVQLTVTVFGSQKQEMWNKCTVQETINIRSFYIHNLFSCDDIALRTTGDHILMEISVQIQKATEDL